MQRTLLVHIIAFFCSAAAMIQSAKDTVSSWPPPMDGYKYEVFSIPWPSGILVQQVVFRNRLERRVVLEHSAIAVRPQWEDVHLLHDVLGVSACEILIDSAEQYALSHGWMTARHADYPTTDLPLSLVLPDYSSFESQLAGKILPELALRYFLDLSKLRIQDLFIAKYDANSGQNQLEYHRDRNTFSFVLPLNEGYAGGGTLFYHTQRIYRPPVGTALIFNGKLWHAGVATTSGVRYIIAGFCEYGDAADNLVNTSYVAEYDGYAPSVGVRSGDFIRGIGVCTVGETGEIMTTLRRVDGGMSPEEWYEAAVSCEQLAPMSSTLMVMERICGRNDDNTFCKEEII